MPDREIEGGRGREREREGWERKREEGTEGREAGRVIQWEKGAAWEKGDWRRRHAATRGVGLE